jgi:hypothetical protein
MFYFPKTNSMMSAHISQGLAECSMLSITGTIERHSNFVPTVPRLAGLAFNKQNSADPTNFLVGGVMFIVINYIQREVRLGLTAQSIHELVKLC